MRQILMVLSAVALAGCQTTVDADPAGPSVRSSAAMERAPGYVRPSDSQAIDQARRVTAAKLKDPEAARFTDMKRKTGPNLRGEPTDVVCGKVNGKNSYGGYIGAKPFVHLVADSTSILIEQDTVGPLIIGKVCPELLR